MPGFGLGFARSTTHIHRDSGGPTFRRVQVWGVYFSHPVGLHWGLAPAHWSLDANANNPQYFTFAAIGQVLHDLIVGSGLHPERYRAVIECTNESPMPPGC